jgi:hypothetical protein
MGEGRRRLGRLGYLLVGALALANGGCLLVAVGAAGGAAAAGYAYYKGRLYRDYPANLNDSLAAVRTSLLELQFPIVTEESKAGESYVATKAADGSNISIYLEVLQSRIPAEGPVTRISVRVATFGDEAVSARILDQISMHLVTPTQLAHPPQPPPPGSVQPAAALTPRQTVQPPLAPSGK